MAPRSLRCLVVLGACLPGVANAATILVDPSGGIGVATIDEALAQADDGDTVVLAPGEYPPTVVTDRVLTFQAASEGVRWGSLEVQGGAITLSGIELVGPGVALAVRGAAVSGAELAFRGGGSKRSDPAVLVSGEASATFTQVTVEDWHSDSGVVVLEGASTTSFSASTFSRNHSADGGAMRIDGGSLVVSESVFSDNSAEAWGGDIAAIGGSVTVHASSFSSSRASYGGAIGAGAGAILLIEDSEFHGPQATSAGGFLYLEDASATVARVAGVDASAEVGGAVALFRGSLLGEDWTFARSRADLGGHLHGAESAVTLRRTHLTAGTAEQGAAVAWSSGDLDVDNALWISQEGAASGGALYVSGGAVDVAQATIADNRAELGSAVAMDGGELVVSASLFHRSRGDAFVVAGTGRMTLADAFVHETDGTLFTGDITVANSVTQDDPRFTSDTSGDYTLRATSDAVDALAGVGDRDGTATDLGAFGGPESWVLPDQDGDGFVYGRDCNDYDADHHEGADDPWYDGIDSDCDERDDYDQDGDGAASAAYGGTDCDDADATVHPSADEVSGDDLDMDCDGLLDRDADGDGWTDGLDCDDTDADIHPMAPDAWYDGIDSDCGGNDDYDADRDGTSTLEGDCDDANGQISPDAVEVADDGVDQDCDGSDLTVEDPDASSHRSDSEVAAAGTDADTPEPERILTKTGCSTVPGTGSVPASFLVAFGLLLFNRRRQDRDPPL